MNASQKTPETLFTLGPIAMDPETIAIGGTQAQYFRTPAFSKLMLECDAMLKEVLDAPNDSQMVFLTASGTAAMEATVMNLFTPKDKILVINGGNFGKRFKEICEIHQISHETIDLKWDESFKPEMLNKFENQGFTGLLTNLCETATGQLYPINIVSDFCKRNHICFVVDVISAIFCDSFSMKQTGADAVILSSQKGLGLHPGMSFVAINKETLDNRCMKNDVKSLYFNFKDYIGNIARGQTPYTPAVGIVNQLYEKLKRFIKSGGMSSSVAYMSELASYFRKKIAECKYYSIPDIPLSNCLTPLYCSRQNASELNKSFIEKYGVYVTPCAGDLAPFLIRVGHMSQQLTTDDIDVLIRLLKKFAEEDN